jgi:TetR/AcrR family transcriptional repressor of nem operon
MLPEAPKKRGDTRERVLQLAEAAVLNKGFAATSIDELIAGAGITKSGFFYHFKDKTELARVMLERYVARETAMFDELFSRADELNEDPLHGFLVGLKMLAEMLSDLPSGHPGCLIAACCYQESMFDQQVRSMRPRCLRGAGGFARASTRLLRAIRRGSRSTSTISPTCCR